jgi:hypothetical protein
VIRLCWNCYLWDVINLNKSADFEYQLSGRVVVITVIRTEVENLLIWLFIVYIKPFFSKSAYTDMRFQIFTLPSWSPCSGRERWHEVRTPGNTNRKGSVNPKHRKQNYNFEFILLLSLHKGDDVAGYEPEGSVNPKHGKQSYNFEFIFSVQKNQPSSPCACVPAQ